MATKKSVVREDVIPLHTFLHRRVQEVPDMTNVKVAQALGYEKPNVVAMMLTGSMKIPLNKVPALARVLELDPVGLLRRVILAYMPELWQTIQDVLGQDRLVTANESALLMLVRDHLGGEDVPLLEDTKFCSELTKQLLAALDRHARQALAHRRDERAARDSKSGRQNAALLDLLRKQALDRAALVRDFKDTD